MIDSKRARAILIIILIFSAVLGCNLPTASNGETADLTDTPEGAEPERESPDAPPAPEDTASPDATATPTVTHTDFPGNPAGVRSFVQDRSTKNLAAERRANADNFAIGLLERPYTSEVMDYVDYLDITRGELSLDETWLYATIYLEGSAPDGAMVYYGLEIDSDIDGRGDWLIYGLVPASTDWTTDGVHMYKDSNNNVGGVFPVNSEAPNSSWDGYDDEVFNQGQGADPDAAWIRRDPSDPNQIQLALKFAQLADNQFMWSVWADEGVHEAVYFDYNDHFTLEEAGSPVLNSNDYPLKALFAVDNTCRWGFGFSPTVNEPGVCAIPVTPTPTQPLCDWNGTWTIWIDGGPNGAPMTTTQTGNTLFATFDDGGGSIYAVNGTVSDDGCTATGTAGEQGFSPIWTFTWMMQANLNQFTGNHDISDFWCGARNGASQPAPCMGP